MNEQELADVEKTSTKVICEVAQSYSGYCCSFYLLGGIGYGIYSGVSYAYRAIVGTTEATEAVIDSEINRTQILYQ